MGHIPDENNDDFMNASAEEWSKPEEPAPAPPKQEETNRWGSPIPDPTVMGDSGPASPRPSSAGSPPAKKSGSKWWIILIIVLVILCLCVCLAVFGLPYLGLQLLPTDWIQF
jgi:hypothetical protein